MIGICDISDISDGDGEVGYWLAREAWGRGFGL